MCLWGWIFGLVCEGGSLGVGLWGVFGCVDQCEFMLKKPPDTQINLSMVRPWEFTQSSTPNQFIFLWFDHGNLPKTAPAQTHLSMVRPWGFCCSLWCRNAMLHAMNHCRKIKNSKKIKNKFWRWGGIEPLHVSMPQELKSCPICDRPTDRPRVEPYCSSFFCF